MCRESQVSTHTLTQPQEDEVVLDAEATSTLRTHLLKVGPEQFFESVVDVGQMPPAILGIAFGIDPFLEERLGEDAFLRLLTHAIIKFYHKRQKLPQYNTIDDAAILLRQSKNIMVITGAGISTSLGIPDFRSKGTGFYSKLLAEGISEPEEVFDIEMFDYDPQIFYKLAHGILPDDTRYTPTHGFIRLLQDKDKLQTNYTQNIDNIEERAGVDKHRLIQCHGSFATATCRKCRYKVKGTDIFPDIRAQRVPRCKRCIEEITAQDAAPKKKQKPNNHRYNSDDDESGDDDIPEPGVMKPDITFFGEKLSDDFFTRFADRDAKSVDLVLVIGTSLKVAPVSEMPNHLPHHVPHIYISREPIEHVNFDVQLLGDCDTVVFELCKRAGWDLKHEMVPDGFAVQVSCVEGSGHKWLVKAKESGHISELHVANGSTSNGEKVKVEVSTVLVDIP